MDTINILLNFLQKNAGKLIPIYKDHYSREGKGILSLILKENSIDVAYLPYEKVMDNLQQEIDKHIQRNNSDENIVYFYLNDNNNSKIVEIDTTGLDFSDNSGMSDGN